MYWLALTINVLGTALIFAAGMVACRFDKPRRQVSKLALLMAVLFLVATGRLLHGFGDALRMESVAAIAAGISPASIGVLR